MLSLAVKKDRNQQQRRRQRQVCFSVARTSALASGCVYVCVGLGVFAGKKKSLRSTTELSMADVLRVVDRRDIKDLKRVRELNK